MGTLHHILIICLFAVCSKGIIVAFFLSSGIRGGLGGEIWDYLGNFSNMGGGLSSVPKCSLIYQVIFGKPKSFGGAKK